MGQTPSATATITATSVLQGRCAFAAVSLILMTKSAWRGALLLPRCTAAFVLATTDGFCFAPEKPLSTWLLLFWKLLGSVLFISLLSP